MSTNASLVFREKPSTHGPAALVFGGGGSFAPGFKATNFGDAIWAGNRVTGFVAVKVGVPSIKLRAFSLSPASKFGSPRHVSRVYPAAIAGVSRFGSAFASISWSAHGWVASSFGIAATTLRASGAKMGAVSIPSIPLIPQSVESSVAVGVPFGSLRQVASGMQVAQMGAHKVLPSAVGVRLGGYGIPSIPLIVTEIPPSDSVGIPNGYLVQKAGSTRSLEFGLAGVVHNSIGRSVLLFGEAAGREVFSAIDSLSGAMFGTPSSPVDTTSQALPVDPSSFFGIPMSFGFIEYQQGLVTFAHGDLVAGFGPPVASWDQFRVAGANSDPAVCGTPASAQSYRADSLRVDPVLPPPSSSMRTYASSMSRGACGRPIAEIVLRSDGVKRVAMVGLPSVRRTCSHDAYGLHGPARFGKPEMTRPAIYRTWAINAGRRMGQPKVRCCA